MYYFRLTFSLYFKRIAEEQPQATDYMYDWYGLETADQETVGEIW